MTDPITIEFSLHYINTDNFKQKIAYNLISLLSDGRMGSFIKFDSYGNISYNDWDSKSHKYPTFTSLPEYNRNKTNALIFSVRNPEEYDGYDTVMIYYSANKTVNYDNCGFVVYNSSNGRTHHHYGMVFTPDDMSIEITKFFMDYKKSKAIKDKLAAVRARDSKYTKHRSTVWGFVEPADVRSKKLRMEKYAELHLPIKTDWMFE